MLKLSTCFTPNHNHSSPRNSLLVTHYDSNRNLYFTLTNRSVLVVYVHWSDRAGRSVHSLLRKPLLCQLCVTLAALTPAVPASAHTTCHLYLLISLLCLISITAVKTSRLKLVRDILKELNGFLLQVGCKIFPFILIYCTDLCCWRGWFKKL